MRNPLIDILSTSISDIGMAALKERISDSKQHEKIEHQLKIYAGEQAKLFFDESAVDYNLDYASLSEYLITGALEDMEKYVFNLDPELNEVILEALYAKALSYSKVNQETDKEFVKKYIKQAVKIIQAFYMEELSKNKKLTIKPIRDDLYEMKTELEKKHNEIMAKLNEKDVVRESVVLPQKERIIFEFTINEAGKMMPMSVKTKNQLRDWYCNNKTAEFEVVVNDKRINALNQHLLKFEEKIRQEIDLAQDEETYYTLYSTARNKYKHESKIKSRAIEFYLKDEILQNCMLCQSYMDLQGIIKRIAEYEKNNRYDCSYITLDFTLKPAPKGCMGYFLANVEIKELKKLFENRKIDINEIGITFGIMLLEVSELSMELLQDVSTEYYIFLAREIMTNPESELFKYPQALNLLNYKMGVH